MALVVPTPIKKITKLKFQAFVDVRDSGLTNMFDSRAVCELSDDVLNREDVIGIIKHFDALRKKYPGVDQRV